MKIIQVAPYYFPHIGGMENCAKAISDRLALNRHQVNVFTSDIGYKKKSKESDANLSIHYLKAWEFAHTPIIPLLFFKLLKIPQDSIIHLHVSQPFVSEIVWLVSKIKNIPYIAQVHSDIGPSGKMGFLLPFYKKIFLRRVLLSASRIIVPTADYVELISNKYKISKNNICIVPCGVDLKNFRQLTVKLHNPIRLLFVGRLQIQKNIPLLIKSFKKILDNNNFNVELNIVGEGEDRNKIIQLIKSLNLENKIHLLGALKGKRLYGRYSNSDIFILTSIYESFGIVLIEAMASGLPVIVSDIPSVRNVVINEKTGMLVSLSEVEFAKVIKEIIINPSLRKKLIANGLKEVKKYDWDSIVKRYEHLYSEVINENN